MTTKVVDADPKASSQVEPISLLMEHMGFNLKNNNAFVSCVTWLEEED